MAARTARQAGRSVQEAADRLAGNQWGRPAVRFGIGARGFVYVVVGYLAMRLALRAAGDSGAGTGQAASGPGAIHALARAPGGRLVVGMLAVGLAAYAVFSGLDAVLHHDGERRAAKRWGERAASVAAAVLYLAFFAYTVSVVVSPTPGRSDSGRSQAKATDVTARILHWPGGRGLVGLLGVTLCVIAVVVSRRGLTQRFERRFDRRQVPAVVRRAVRVLGVVGLVGRGLAFATVGAELVAAAVLGDPGRGQGLDGSLRLLTRAWYGPYLLFPLAVGLLAYGGYLGLEAGYRKV